MLSLLRATRSTLPTYAARSGVRAASTRAARASANPKVAPTAVKAQAAAESAPPIIPDGATVALHAELPSMEAVDAVESLIIPTEPDNYTHPSERQDDSYPVRATRVVTAAALSTHIEAPSLTAGQVQTSLEDVDNNSAEKGSHYLKNDGESIGFSAGASQFFGDMFAGVKGVAQSEGEGKEGEEKGEGKEFKFEDRDLSKEERSGLLVLGGIVLGGFVVGGLTKPRSKATKKH